MRKQKGQVALEYLIIFVILAVLAISLLSSSDANSFYSKVKGAAETLFVDATERIVQ